MKTAVYGFPKRSWPVDVLKLGRVEEEGRPGNEEKSVEGRSLRGIAKRRWGKNRGKC